MGQNPPCAAADPAAGYTDPLTDYPHPQGEVITAGAFIPNGHWPAEYDGGYLFADAGSGIMWLRRANGTVDYSAPFATGPRGHRRHGLRHDARQHRALLHAHGRCGPQDHDGTGRIRRIPGPLSFVAVPPGNRVLDTRLTSAGAKTMRANTTRYVPLNVDPAVTKAVLVNFAFVTPSTPGFLTAWAGRTATTGCVEHQRRRGRSRGRLGRRAGRRQWWNPGVLVLERRMS